MASARHNGKLAVVTGAASGIGEAAAARLEAEGATVILVDAADPKSEGLRCRVDVSNEADWADVVAAVDRYGGTVDILVTAAGVIRSGGIELTDKASFRRILDVNLVGTFLALKHVGARFTAGSAAVLISSTAGIRGASGTSAYTASKWAVRGLARCAAIEFGPLGARVVCLCPGAIDTPMVRTVMTSDADLVARWGDRLLVPRMGQAEELAGWISFLASSEAAYATGTDFIVDGGVSAQ